jgi:hypothetical protein
MVNYNQTSYYIINYYITGDKCTGKSSCARLAAGFLPQKSVTGPGYLPNISGGLSMALLTDILAHTYAPVLYDPPGNNNCNSFHEYMLQ